MADAQDFNGRIIEEFRGNAGKVGGPFEGATMLLLHSTGAKSGKERVNPLMYQEIGSGYAIFASKAGGPTNPDWYHNLLAKPEATIEVGAETVPVAARIAEGAEREQIWTEQMRRAPGFAEYEKATTRTIPVVILEPRGVRAV